MSDKPFNYDLDDELLSAYIDGELSADQRAAIEARLAADPTARQLLHELRSVSQSVQAMPQEKLGRDLSESIVRRALDAKPKVVRGSPNMVVRGSPDPAHATDRRSPSTADSLPKLSLFRSKRAWIWSSLAVAAGLLIMIVQSADQWRAGGQKLPQVAQNNTSNLADRPAAETAQTARRELAPAAAPESPGFAAIAADKSTKEKAAAPPPAMTAPTVDELHDNTKHLDAAGSVAAATPAMGNKKADLKPTGESYMAKIKSGSAPTDNLGSSPTSTAGPSHLGGAKSDNAAGEQAPAAGPAKPMFVVHVVAKQDAINKKTFDQLLAKHDIQFEPQPLEPSRQLAAGRATLPEGRGGGLNEGLKNATKDRAVDLVLVEAPASAIVSCLDVLHKDTNDYLRIDVEKPPTARDRADTSSASTKKLEDDITRYNRRMDSPAQTDSFGGYREFYDQYYKMLDGHEPSEATRGADFDGGTAGRPETRAATSADAKKEQKQSLGRATRMTPIGTERGRSLENERASEPPSRAPSDAREPKKPAPLRELAERSKSAAQNQNWKVLFVLTPEESAAPSAPSTSPAK